MSTIEKAAARLSKAGAAAGTEAEQPSPAAPGMAVGTGQAVHPLPSSRAGASGVAAAGHVELDIDALVEAGYLSPKGNRTQLSQDLRRIKRPLLLNAQKQVALGLNDGKAPANVVMVTSAVPGEGKTFISINLALSLAAELDRRVLLVDGDLAKGDLSRQLNVSADRGLSDLLSEQSFLREDGVLTTNIDRLSLLLAGDYVDHVDELYASDRMRDIVNGLAAEDPDRMVVFDAPPLLATTEAAVMASLMGQVLMVVESNNTPQNAVVEAYKHLENCESVSLLLNKATSRPMASYGYGYSEVDR